MKKLLEILEDIRPDVNFEEETALVTDGVLDSFDIVSIVGEINDQFDVDIYAEDLIPENFDSAEAMMKLIERHLDE